MTKKILITGGTGFLGCHLAEYLIDKGFSVTTFSRKNMNITHAKSYSHINGDITDINETIEIVKNVDGVIHLAAVSREGQGLLNPYDCIKVNVLGTLNILEAIRPLQRKPWLILASSAAVRDVVANDYCTLKTSNTTYGISKLFNELCAHRYSIEHKMQIIALRFESIYGSLRDNPEKVINKFVTKALTNQAIEIYDVDAKLNFIHYKDIIRAMGVIIERFSSIERSYYQDIYLGSKFGIKIEELAQKIVKLCNSKSKIVVIHKKNENDEYSNLRLQSELDKPLVPGEYYPSIGLEEGLRDLIGHFRSQRNLAY